MQNKKFIFPLMFLAVLFLPHHIFGQQSNTMYFMRGVPQIYQVNPAFQPDCNFFLGFPLLAPLQVDVENSAFGLSDVLMYDEGLDSLITFLHPNADQDLFLGLLKDRNYVNTEFRTSIGSVGFRMKNAYLTFDINTRGNIRMGYPGDLFRLPIKGLGEDMTYDFNGFGVNATVWNEFAMGLSYKITDNLSLGWRGKILMGAMDVQMKKFDVVLKTGEESWDINSDILFNAALPAFNVGYDTAGMIDPGSIEPLEFPGALQSVLANPKNRGLAMDIGMDYKPLDWLQVSVSLTDFGNIYWSDKVYNISSSGSFQFTGIEMTQDEEDSDFLESLTDSIEQMFQFSASENAYRTWLSSKFYAGVSFYVHPKINFGILSRTEFMSGDIRQQFTFSANLYPIRMFSLALSSSIIEGNYKNLGLGLSLKPGPFNFYLITDTGPSIAFWPFDARSVNIRTGLNLTFGCRKIKKEPKYDIPFSP